MNSFSFSSEEDQNEPHCLQHEIGFEQIGDWRGNSEEKADFDAENVESMVSEFDMDFSSDNGITHSFAKHTDGLNIIETFVPESPPE